MDLIISFKILETVKRVVQQQSYGSEPIELVSTMKTLGNENKQFKKNANKNLQWIDNLTSICQRSDHRWIWKATLN